LKEYRKKHGHVRIPQKVDEPKGLGNWVLDQRRRYRERNLPANEKSSKKGPLTEEEIKKLESIGFEWSLRCRGCGAGSGGEEGETGSCPTTYDTPLEQQVEEIPGNNNNNEETSSVMVDFTPGREGGKNNKYDPAITTTTDVPPTQQEEEEGDDHHIAITNNEMDISATSAKNLKEAADELFAI
jgi:hypothetical protein